MKELFFPCEKPLRQDIGGSAVTMILTTAEHLVVASRETSLVKSNLRVQSMNSTTEEILAGLKENPELFPMRSGAIKFTCSDIRYEPARGGVVLTIDESDGISDGGGRTAVLTEAGRIGIDLSKVFVFIQIVSGLDDEGKTDACITANTARKVPTFSIVNKQGLFEPIKTMWGSKLPFVVYYEGQHATEISFSHAESATTNITFLISLLVSVSDTYNSSARGSHKHPMSVVKGGGIFSARGMAKASINNRLHLLGDLYDIWLYGMTQTRAHLNKRGWENKHGRPLYPSTYKPSRTANRKTHFPHTTKTWDGTISPLIPIPVVAATRVFLSDNKWTVPRGWLLDVAVPALWAQYKTALTKNTEYHGQTSVRTALDNEGLWSSLTDKAHSLQIDRLQSMLSAQH